MKYDRKANLSTKSCSDFSIKIDAKLEIVQNAKSCSKYKKLLKPVVQLEESPSGCVLVYRYTEGITIVLLSLRTFV